MDSQSEDLMNFLMSSTAGMPAAPLHVDSAHSATPPATPRAKTIEEKEMSQTPTPPTWQYRKGASVASVESAVTPQAHTGLSTPPSTTKKGQVAVDPQLVSEIDAVAKKLDNELKIQSKEGEGKAEVTEKNGGKRKTKEEMIQKAMASNGDTAATDQATGLNPKPLLPEHFWSTPIFSQEHIT